MFSIRPRFLSRARKLSCLPLKSMGNGEWKVSCLLVSSLCMLSHSDTSDSFVTPWTVAHQAPLSTGIYQARILEWVSMPSSKGSSWLRDWTQVSHVAGGFFTVLATWQYSAAWVKSHKAFFTQGASLVAQMVKNPPAMQETWHLSLGQEDPLAKGMATHSYILAWRIPWIEEPGGLHTVHGVTKESDTTEQLTLFIQSKWKLLILMGMHLRQTRFRTGCKVRPLSLHISSILKC